LQHSPQSQQDLQQQQQQQQQQQRPYATPYDPALLPAQPYEVTQSNSRRKQSTPSKLAGDNKRSTSSSTITKRTTSEETRNNKKRSLRRSLLGEESDDDDDDIIARAQEHDDDGHSSSGASDDDTDDDDSDDDEIRVSKPESAIAAERKQRYEARELSRVVNQIQQMERGWEIRGKWSRVDPRRAALFLVRYVQRMNGIRYHHHHCNDTRTVVTNQIPLHCVRVKFGSETLRAPIMPTRTLTFTIPSPRSTACDIAALTDATTMHTLISPRTFCIDLLQCDVRATMPYAWQP
jgi:hypothetical protein